ncbi:MAG: hypothetical protein N2C14_26400, partial [Planctomycetales bacterium]
MVTRSRLAWKPNSKGYYERNIGWKQTKNGKLQQHKFLLGTDLREAQKRERKLRELWEEYERGRREKRPLWPPGLLDVAKKVAKGAAEVAIPRKPNEMQMTYADRIRRLQSAFPVITFVPVDFHAHEVGVEALSALEALPGVADSLVLSQKATDVSVMRTWIEANARLEEIGLGWSGKQLRLEASPSTKDDHPQSAEDQKPIAVNSGPTGALHAALRDYVKWIEEEYFRDELGGITAWGATRTRQVKRLIAHHRDGPLATLDYEAVDKLFAYWRRRPLRKNSGKSVTAKSASHHISELKRFLIWLHKSSRYAWRKPEGFEDVSTRVAAFPGDKEKSLQQVNTFLLDELVLLMK